MTAGDDFDAGGESACWMHLVCPACGAVLGDHDDHESRKSPRASLRRLQVVGSIAISDPSPDQSVWNVPSLSMRL